MEDGRTLQLVSFRMESREIAALDRQARRAGLSRSELIRMRLAMPIEVDSGCRWYSKQAADGRSKRFARDPGEGDPVPEGTPEKVRFMAWASPEEERRWRMRMFKETGTGSYLYGRILADGSLHDPAKAPSEVHGGGDPAPEEARARLVPEAKQGSPSPATASETGPAGLSEETVKVLLTDAAWRDLKVELTRWGTNFNQGVRSINAISRRLNANRALRKSDVDEIVAALRTVARTLDGCRKGLGKVGEMVDGIAADYGARRSDRGR